MPEIQFRLRLSKVGNSLRVTIPKAVVDSFKLKEGDTLLMSATGNEIIIRKSGGKKR